MSPCLLLPWPYDLSCRFLKEAPRSYRARYNTPSGGVIGHDYLLHHPGDPPETEDQILVSDSGM